MGRRGYTTTTMEQVLIGFTSGRSCALFSPLSGLSVRGHLISIAQLDAEGWAASGIRGASPQPPPPPPICKRSMRGRCCQDLSLNFPVSPLIIIRRRRDAVCLSVDWRATEMGGQEGERVCSCKVASFKITCSME